MKLYHFDDLTEINVPFGLLDEDTQARLTRGGPLEMFIGWKWEPKIELGFSRRRAYRAAPSKPMIVPWHAIKEGWDWAAADNSGKVYVYRNEPRAKTTAWLSDCEGPVEKVPDFLAGFDRGTVRWDQSLQKRPGK